MRAAAQAVPFFFWSDMEEKEGNVTPESLDKDVAELLGDNLSVNKYVSDQIDQINKGSNDQPPQTDVADKSENKVIQIADEPKGTQTDVADKSDNESYTIEQYRTTLGDRPLEAVVKAYDNMTAWEKNLKEKSQAISLLKNLNPEQERLLVTQLKPYVDSKADIPGATEDLINPILDDLQIPESIAYKTEDEDGLEMDINIPREQFLPVVKTAVTKAIEKLVPEVALLSDYQKKLEDSLKANDSLLQQNGELVINHFFSKHSEFMLKESKEGELPSQTLFRIYESGEDHPQYRDAKNLMDRFEAAGSLSEKNKISMDQAWEQLYGKSDREKKRKEEADKSILESQSQAQQERPKSKQMNSENEGRPAVSYTEYIEDVFK